jgi:DNA-binding MurR/RpiR family transcriptional regulator
VGLRLHARVNILSTADRQVVIGRNACCVADFLSHSFGYVLAQVRCTYEKHLQMLKNVEDVILILCVDAQIV